MNPDKKKIRSEYCCKKSVGKKNVKESNAAVYADNAVFQIVLQDQK